MVVSILFLILKVLGAFLALMLALVVAVSVIASFLSVILAIVPAPKVPLRYNLRNFQARWWTVLVVLAVAMVIALLTVMLAFVRGMDALTEGGGHPGNVLVLSDGATDEAFSNLGAGFSIELLPKEIQDLVVKNAKGQYLATKEVYVVVTHMIEMSKEGGRKRRFVQMRGLDNPELAGEVHEVTLDRGSWFSSTGVPEVVLGNGIAKAFGQDVGKSALDPGDEVQIGKIRWKVAGVMSPNSSSFGSEIWVHDQIVQSNFGRTNSYSSFVVRAPNAKLAKAASKLIKEMRTEKAVQAVPEREYYAKLGETSKQFAYAINFVAIVMAIGGVLGVMITMFAAVSQRTKDIGVLRLLGFSRWQILFSFLLESLVFGLAGTIVGILIGSLCHGVTASSIVTAGAGGGGKSIIFKLMIDHWIILTDLAYGLLMGAAGGFIPAFSAMRLRPLESLK